MSNYETATLGGGCFWCLEAIYQDVKGVQHVASGYAGGEVVNPTYKAVCSGSTGHAEVIRVTYDPAVISYEDIFYIFWRIHDPTTLNRQGADVGTQYRSIILYLNDVQKQIAEKSLAETTALKLWSNPIVTEIAPMTNFYEAETYHQNYYNDNGNQPYCRFVIDPKVKKFRKMFADRLKTAV